VSGAVDGARGRRSDAGMSFRDDREAAHRRADALEQELKRTKEELEAMRSPRREGRHGGKVVAAVVALGALGAGVYTTQRSVERRREEAQAEAERAHAEQVEQAERAVRVALEAARAAEARAEAERAREAASLSPPTPTAPAAAIVWRGSVDQAVGVALAPGAPCTLEGAFAPTGGGVVARSLTIACGGQQIYRAGPEAASASASLREGPVHGSGVHEYMLRYSDEASPTRATALVTLLACAFRPANGHGLTRVPLPQRRDPAQSPRPGQGRKCLSTRSSSSPQPLRPRVRSGSCVRP